MLFATSLSCLHQHQTNLRSKIDRYETHRSVLCRCNIVPCRVCSIGDMVSQIIQVIPAVVRSIRHLSVPTSCESWDSHSRIWYEEVSELGGERGAERLTHLPSRDDPAKALSASAQPCASAPQVWLWMQLSALLLWVYPTRSKAV